MVVAAGFALSVVAAPSGLGLAEEQPSDDTMAVPPDPTAAEASDTTVPDSTVPDSTVPDSTVPDSTVPDSTVPVPVPVDSETMPPPQNTSDTLATPSTMIDTATETPVDAEGPAALPASMFAASALTGVTLSISNTPFSVTPATLDFGSYFLGARAFETVTIANDTGRELYVDLYGTGAASITGIGGCGAFVLPPPTVGSTASLYLGVDERCDVSIDLDTSGLGTVNGQLVVTDTDFGQTTTVGVAAEIVPPDPPANDDWTNAQDISTLTIPGWVGEPGLFGNQQPRDTVQIDGNTTYATYESGEYDPGRGGGSVWFKYTSPPGGFSGRLGYRATPGFFVEVSTANTSATESRRAKGNSATPAINFVRMEPGHTIWFSVFNESPFVDPGAFTLELFQAPNEQDAIAIPRSGTGEGEFALVDDFNLFGDGDTHHLTPDLGGAPNGWSTLRFDRPGSLTVTYRSSTASSPGGAFDPNEGSERPLGLRVYRSPQATRLSDPNVLGAPIAVGAGRISSDPAAGATITGTWFETTATVAVTPGRYYWTFEEGSGGPTFFVQEWQFRASTIDTEPPTASITTPPDGARYIVGSVPSTLVSTCTDNQGPTSSFITVDGAETTTLATTIGSHTVSLECTDSAGNMVAVTSTYTVVAPPTGPCVIVDTRSVDFGDVTVGSASPARPVVVRSCSDAPVRLAVSVSDATSGGGGSQTWLASTSTVPAADQFTWSVTPPGGPSPIPVGRTQTTVGAVLAPGASRTDDHRIALGPTGPGLGTRFTSTFTYTALTP